MLTTFNLRTHRQSIDFFSVFILSLSFNLSFTHAIDHCHKRINNEKKNLLCTFFDVSRFLFVLINISVLLNNINLKCWCCSVFFFSRMHTSWAQSNFGFVFFFLVVVVGFFFNENIESGMFSVNYLSIAVWWGWISFDPFTGWSNAGLWVWWAGRWFQCGHTWFTRTSWAWVLRRWCAIVIAFGAW